MRADELVARLQKVRQRSPGQWMACCPAHQDRSASLSIRDADGRVLLHCFAGCETDDVLGAMGLRMTDIMPERLTHEAPRRRIGAPAADMLRALERELTIVAIVASDIQEKREIRPEDWARFSAAAALLIAARASLDE